MAKHLVIVESPTKAKTIRKFLGSDYDVVASMGHVRDLPSSASEIPASKKDKKWAQLGVDVEHDFEPLYVIPRKKSKVITELKKKLKDAEDIYLATDEDREGESISEGLLKILKPKVPVKRMVFHEITKSAIDDALAHPRDIDERLVRAQETRRILDRLVGYTVSPVLWKKIAFGLSAGRVQSAALKAIIDRERERMRFKKAAYWDVEASVQKDASPFNAKLARTDGKRIATGKDFDETNGELKKKADVALVDEEKAKAIAKEVADIDWKVGSVTEKPFSRKAPAPFTTSTLQQEANRKLGLSSRDAMRTAQALYEKGHITYMRTDSTTLSGEALQAIRKAVDARFGSEYVPSSSRTYATKAKGAQEAHEAIRPSLTFATSDEIGLSGAERDLYELIWMRTLASQMPDSKQLRITAVLEAASHEFHASGMKILFPGFLRAYIEGADDVEQALEEKESLLPDLKEGDTLTCLEAKPLSHETKPPARFTEATLVQYMEQVGIGRPSTYASTISTLLDRKYVYKAGNALIPTFTGMAVTQLLERHFDDLVNADFTSNMEQSLDRIASGEEEWLPYLKNFYLGDNGLQHRVEEKTESINPEQAKTVELPKTLENYKVKVGKFGPYIEATLPKTGAVVKTNIPTDMAPADTNEEALETLVEKAQQGPTSLGQDPETGKFIYLKTGAYGPYLQLGEQEEGSKKKPKRASIPKDIPMESVDHEIALKLLSLPRLLGMHPETGKEIRAGIGRFGPYIVHDGDFRSLKKDDNVLDVTLERALELLAQPKRGRASSGKELGKDPDDGKPITLHEGKYGPYVKHGKTNATIPKDIKPEDVTLEKALALIAEKKSKPKKRKTKS